MLLSHDQHADNLDPAGRAFLARVELALTTPIVAGRLGGRAQGMLPWQTIEITATSGARLHITATPARHGPVGIGPIAGDVTGFLLGVDETVDVSWLIGCDG